MSLEKITLPPNFKIVPFTEDDFWFDPETEEGFTHNGYIDVCEYLDEFPGVMLKIVDENGEQVHVGYPQTSELGILRKCDFNDFESFDDIVCNWKPDEIHRYIINGEEYIEVYWL